MKRDYRKSSVSTKQPKKIQTKQPSVTKNKKRKSKPIVTVKQITVIQSEKIAAPLPDLGRDNLMTFINSDEGRKILLIVTSLLAGYIAMKLGIVIRLP